MERKEVRCKRSQSSGLAWRSLSVVWIITSQWGITERFRLRYSLVWFFWFVCVVEQGWFVGSQEEGAAED